MAKPDFITLDTSFKSLLGANAKIECLLEEPSGIPLFHEAGVYIAKDRSVFITSNRRQKDNGGAFINILKVSLPSKEGEKAEYEVIHPDISMGNGGVNYQDGILFCDQGSKSRVGGLVKMKLQPPYEVEPVVTDFHGVPFNSVNDVIVAKDGAVWFTDPVYGFEQGFRERPQLPAQVYRFDPKTKQVRAMADGFGRPNGLAFDPEEEVLYVTDTDHIHGDGTIDPTRASTIYAFDLLHYSRTHAPFLTNRRLFAFSPGRAPDGIKCDTAGNVYSGCLDGIHVWSPSGVALGKIAIPGGVANFCFCEEGEIVAMNETRLWRVQLGKGVRGALLEGMGAGGLGGGRL